MNCGKELSIEKEKDVKNSNDRVFDWVESVGQN
jgi:hypothetical protein